MLQKIITLLGLLIIGFVLIVSFGCGYLSYKAYYTPEYVIAQGKNAIMDEPYFMFPHKLCNYDVDVSVWPIWEKDIRECFKVNVSIGNFTEIDKSVDLKVSNFNISIDSVTVTSQSKGTIWTLPHISTNIYNGITHLYFGRLCLKRKHNKILVRFHATIKSDECEQGESHTYEMELVRWENRNWLGLE